MFLSILLIALTACGKGLPNTESNGDLMPEQEEYKVYLGAQYDCEGCFPGIERYKYPMREKFENSNVAREKSITIGNKTYNLYYKESITEGKLDYSVDEYGAEEDGVKILYKSGSDQVVFASIPVLNVDFSKTNEAELRLLAESAIKEYADVELSSMSYSFTTFYWQISDRGASVSTADGYYVPENAEDIFFHQVNFSYNLNDFMGGDITVEIFPWANAMNVILYAFDAGELIEYSERNIEKVREDIQKSIRESNPEIFQIDPANDGKVTIFRKEGKVYYSMEAKCHYRDEEGKEVSTGTLEFVIEYE